MNNFCFSSSQGGIYLLEVMDGYAAGWPFLVIGLMELFVVAYVYGKDLKTSSLKEMDIKSTFYATKTKVLRHLAQILYTGLPDSQIKSTSY